jgi:YtcA family
MLQDPQFKAYRIGDIAGTCGFADPSHCRLADCSLGLMPSAEGDDVNDTSLCCAPIINLWGAYWPAWVLCLLSGIILTLVSRLIFTRTRLEPHLGPLLLVYPMLIVAYACGLWLLLYRA